ncbi:N-6 DNA methylase, partial [Salmonella enterica]|uniref:N-6 DNA methylase n=1 Tax=Salmonella enterica TaxID=28901 RepID=UPI003D2B1DBD
MSLFDFKFNVIPVEFISYIYEVFLNEQQKKNGIYYTPKKLAQLIVDDVIFESQTGTVLDPSCGSGMFLIVAFQRLFENSKHEWENA